MDLFKSLAPFLFVCSVSKIGWNVCACCNVSHFFTFCSPPTWASIIISHFALSFPAQKTNYFEATDSTCEAGNDKSTVLWRLKQSFSVTTFINACWLADWNSKLISSARFYRWCPSRTFTVTSWVATFPRKGSLLLLTYSREEKFRKSFMRCLFILRPAPTIIWWQFKYLINESIIVNQHKKQKKIVSIKRMLKLCQSRIFQNQPLVAQHHTTL